ICEERGRVARELFEAVGEAISDPESLPALALALQAETLMRCDATYSGAVAALRELADAGYKLSIASSQESEYLRPALAGTGINELMAHYFGPDLVDIAKEGPEFYQKVF